LHPSATLFPYTTLFRSELELQLDPLRAEAEADDAAQLRSLARIGVVVGPVAANLALEAFAQPRDQAGERGFVGERLQRAVQVRGGVVPGRHPRRFRLVRIPAGGDVVVRAVHDGERLAAMSRLGIG